MDWFHLECQDLVKEIKQARREMTDIFKPSIFLQAEDLTHHSSPEHKNVDESMSIDFENLENSVDSIKVNKSSIGLAEFKERVYTSLAQKFNLSVRKGEFVPQRDF